MLLKGKCWEDSRNRYVVRRRDVTKKMNNRVLLQTILLLLDQHQVYEFVYRRGAYKVCIVGNINFWHAYTIGIKILGKYKNCIVYTAEHHFILML